MASECKSTYITRVYLVICEVPAAKRFKSHAFCTETTHSLKSKQVTDVGNAQDHHTISQVFLKDIVVTIMSNACNLNTNYFSKYMHFNTSQTSSVDSPFGKIISMWPLVWKVCPLQHYAMFLCNNECEPKTQQINK